MVCLTSKLALKFMEARFFFFAKDLRPINSSDQSSICKVKSVKKKNKEIVFLAGQFTLFKQFYPSENGIPMRPSCRRRDKFITELITDLPLKS